jgi:hypothetical protein
MKAKIIFDDLNDPDQQFDHACCMAGRDAILTLWQIRELLRGKAKYSDTDDGIYEKLFEDVMDCVPESINELMNKQ